MSEEVPTTRVRLARVAQNCATLDVGVAHLHDGGGRISTPVAGRAPIGGVQVIADAHGGYRVEVHVVAVLAPLTTVADQLRDKIRDAAASVGLADEVAAIDVHIDGLLEPLED